VVTRAGDAGAVHRDDPGVGNVVTDAVAALGVSHDLPDTCDLDSPAGVVAPSQRCALTAQ
jgi:hypothetical protein